MEEEHIFTTSRLRKIQKNIEAFKKDFQKYKKSKSSKAKVAQEISTSEDKKTEKIAKSTTVKKESKKQIPKQKAEKILALSLLSAFAVIMGLGIYITYNGPFIKNEERTSGPALSTKIVVSPTQVETKPSPSPTPTPHIPTINPADNSSWVLYANQSYGYLVKHPETTTPKDLTDETNLSFVSFVNKQNENETFFSITVRETALEEEVNYIRKELKDSLVKLENEEDITFKNLRAKRLDYVASKFGEQKSTTFVVINKDNYCYSISTLSENIDEILSVFQFTN